ncbi:MAG: hypothetical protein KDC66_04420 [Phaeodactylibacter sp.]|nr:hypothetical protein [Phaeodactylibacter sp.]MCB9276053.1 hypothetical protein [Lewinellaceae bacterium]
MEQNINLLISGKHCGASLEEFFMATGFSINRTAASLPLPEALALLGSYEGNNILLLATTHHGQHLILEDGSDLLGAPREKRILAFTRNKHTDALAMTLGDEAGISWYNYYRDGKMQRSVTFEEAEPEETGRPTPFEKNGLEPHAVLASYCDSWRNLAKLEWTAFECANM